MGLRESVLATLPKTNKTQRLFILAVLRLMLMVPGPVSGDSFANPMADQATPQALEQAKFGVAGDGGDDNIEANTTIIIG